MSSAESIANGIAMMERFGDNFHGELLRAVGAKRINLSLMSRTSVLPKLRLRASRLPVIVLIGDDDYQATGPAGWRCADDACALTPAAIVHAAGGEPAHYQRAVTEAERWGGLLLVETDAAHALAWAGAINAPVSMVVPRGGVHPVLPNRSAMQ